MSSRAGSRSLGRVRRPELTAVAELEAADFRRDDDAPARGARRLAMRSLQVVSTVPGDPPAVAAVAGRLARWRSGSQRR